MDSVRRVLLWWDLFVKMLLAALKHKGRKQLEMRLQIGVVALTYHAALSVSAVGAAWWIGGLKGALLGAAFLPVVVRAVYGWLAWLDQPPPFKRVGMMEAVYAVWFTIAASIALSQLG